MRDRILRFDLVVFDNISKTEKAIANFSAKNWAGAVDLLKQYQFRCRFSGLTFRIKTIYI